MSHTHVTAPTQFIEAKGIRFAFRRFGTETGVPLVFMQHFRGGLDHWDPAITDGLARNRPVILFDNAGVAGSSGETPETIEAMGDFAVAFIRALGLAQVDLLGFSMGGYVAQAVTLQEPTLVRRLMLLGTGPSGGEPSQDANFPKHATSTDPTTGECGLDAFLYLFFSPSAESQRAGRAFWERRHQRKADVDKPSSEQTMRAQLASFQTWRQVKGERFAALREISQPTLVVNGNNDVMVPTINSYTLAQHIPNAQLIIYPDAGHGSQFQYPDLFLAHARLFLDS
ncbi:alpha/beta fold hydrolase [Bradyrhizobium mercantei]|uniref:alpha/beta fold hydrolase n=1 Tax=Bradyrhizobium mercantei TaxID=1904807 RepID=UPI000977E8D1|nr:alpha/beta hydrolase [Bradyrhizobium mercantei]